ncbi:Hypothetical predicted protein [Cloeon dipterum]|uniref:Uncharacterized protein n=1 Tax=Cloeon dipterum TaxID=197152 RepID=A0A8S1D567_9INSE|nr:Hypothetical predicted protein [Cloeon dipterum]
MDLQDTAGLRRISSDESRDDQKINGRYMYLIYIMYSKITKIIRHQKFAADRIRAIAADCGVKLEPDFELQHIVQLPTNLVEKIVLKLMAKKCTKLIREEEEFEVLMFPALSLFLAMRPAKIDLTAFLTFCPMRLKCRYFTEVVIRISKKNPEVEELSLATLANRFFLTIDEVADAELLEALGKLTRLKSLRIEEIFEFRLVDVIDLCKNLPHLENLKIVLERSMTDLELEELEIAEKMKTAMSKLKVFMFDTRGSNTSLINLCAEHLPNLRVIGDFSDGFSTFDDCNTMADIACAPNGTSDLRHLLLDFESIECCDEIQLAKFPLVRHLMLSIWPENGIEDRYLESWLSQLSNLESLHIEFLVPPNVIRRFLEKFGSSLRALYILYCIEDPNETNLSFSDIFALCPKLERLHLGGNILEDAAPLTSFSQLRELGLDMFREYNNRIKLSEILQAPFLEKITLFGDCLDFEDLKKTTGLIADKKILTGLRNLHVINYSQSFRDLDVEYFQEISAFIKCAVASIPGLNDVKFDVNGLFSGYSVLARSMRDGKTQNSDVPGITQFFAGQIIDGELLNLYVDEELIQVLDKFF